ncbi:lipoprotein-releasing ABC transporter ATP-binding protein LolD [Candidatus Kryptobacter tengchongensis]|uniref:Lipoprotein-releasing system ATP-binding protein n=1 Tax=Kryptobacter tengchongensis TaxID=1643429 RepID=A0A656D1X4_KRYT1|nr:lipoprotein-releasing system ATP-binding protein [Candidatus Kryptobacter tengchongensis]
MKNIVLRAENIHKIFWLGRNVKLHVLKGIDLEVKRGEIVAIVGASGAGKSTLLHILGTLDRPSEGKVYVDGVDVFQMSDVELAKFRNRKIGFVFQFHHLLPEFTAIENVAMPAMIAGKSFNEAKDRAYELLKEVGLADRIEHKPSELSGGEQQRVAVARALMNSPEIILADEPSGNLDSQNAEALHDLIVELNKKHGQTFIIATHNEKLAERADRIVKIVDGKIHEIITAG